jgi:oxygen-independent coproporphyrinogen III oxidase
MPAIVRNVGKSLYVHVPFCAHKCEYCAFYSTSPGAGQIEEYLAAFERELSLTAAGLKPETIYIGGGTPTLLNMPEWSRLLKVIHRLDLSALKEWTVECNPATVSLEKAALLRDHGVNRMSMGVQSLDESLLQRLGRIHTRDMALGSFEILRKAGFDNLNLDLMFAIPGQTMEIWEGTLAEALAMGSEHLSCYEVIYEEDTPLFEQLKAGKVDVDEDLACAMYELMIEKSSGHGFRQYEVANFARHSGTAPSEIPDRACRHNLNYWRGGPFRGLGPSASSYVEGVRTKNWSNTLRYCDELSRGRLPVESRDVLSPQARAGEIAGFGLRMTAGWPFELFRETTGFDLCEHWADEMSRLIGLGYAEQDATSFRLTAKGLRFADWAVELFLR